MIAPIDPLVSRVETLFDANGVLATSPGYEHRPQQREMATRVAECLSNRQHLIVEAGTGIGKSLAYLLPALCYAEESGKKALLSTYTINLQEQLFFKDIPLARKILPFELKATLLKGRQNYICPTRLKRAREQAKDLFVRSEVAELDRIWEWLQITEDGTLSDFEETPSYKVWSQVCSEPHICTSRTCGHDLKCFYQQARKRLLDANVIVLNHTLFFSCLGGLDEETDAENGFLFPEDFVVFDEAHRLESVAARHIGITVSSSALRYQLQRLYHPGTRKGLLAVLRRGELQESVVELLEETDSFFGKVREACRFGQGTEARVREPDLVEDNMSLPLMKLRKDLMDAASELDDETTQLELRDMAHRLSDFRTGLKLFLSQEAEGHVYWVERVGQDFANLQLQAAPVDLAEVLRETLFRRGRSAILTSATLSVGKGLTYVQRQLGAESAQTLELDSPFDYPRQMEIFLPRMMPDPRAQNYEEALRRWICHLITRSDGGAFVLFTSYGVLKRLAQGCEGYFKEKEWPLLVQGGGASRMRLLASFRKSGRAVLFGTDSFWQGVDVPGSALRNVIITKLPFAVPDHPLTEAKMDLIRERNGDPFREYSLPEAILKFRQGVGRLIRTASDQGTVAILDSRIFSKPYGRLFLAKIPQCPVRTLEDPGESRK